MDTRLPDAIALLFCGCGLLVWSTGHQPVTIIHVRENGAVPVPVLDLGLAVSPGDDLEIAW